MPTTTDQPATVFAHLDVTYLQRGRYQPRIDFNEESLQELAASMATQGLIEPIVVREVAKNCYEIIAGERRWHAAKRNQWREVPCLIGKYTDQQAASLTLIENIQRQDLNAIEEARGYRRLMDEFNLQQEEVAVLVGKSRSHVANTTRLLTLCSDVQQSICEGLLGFGHARVLVGLHETQQRYFATQVIEQNWSVRHLEEQVRMAKKTITPVVSPDSSMDVARLESALSEQVGAPVQISREKNQSGWLKIKYFDNDTLAGLLERMGLRYD